MTDIATFENAVRKFVEELSRRDCYIQEQMGAIPATPYCTIYLKDITVPNYDVLTHECVPVAPEDEEAGTQLRLTVRGQCMITVAMSAWGGTAGDVMQICSRLRNAILADARWSDLWKIAGKGGTGNIIPIPEEYEGERRQRAEFNMVFHTALEDVFIVEHFNEVDITCTVDGDKQRTIQVGIDDDTYGNIAELWGEMNTNWELIG